MSARVLLFVEGPRGPKAVYSWPTAPPVQWVEQRLDAWIPERHDGPARRWWLVECESAAAGRLTIAHAGHRWPSDSIADDGTQTCSCGERFEPDATFGRILASGGDA